MNNLNEYRLRELSAARIHAAAFDSPVTKHFCEHFEQLSNGYWLSFSTDYDKKQFVLTFTRNIQVMPGSVDDISLHATELGSRDYIHTLITTLHVARKWRIEEHITYTQHLTEDELETLRALGKMKTYNCNYEAITC